METRATELRRRHRRILAWSLSIAAALHIAVFLLWPTMEVDPLPTSDSRVQAVTEASGTVVYVDVVFGPPAINEEDGSVALEPPDRVLQADRILRLPTECEALGREGLTPVQGLVRLRVSPSGHTDIQALTESTGDECADEVILTVADALRYLWLPSERFPAPVDLVQPVTLTEARG